MKHSLSVVFAWISFLFSPGLLICQQGSFTAATTTTTTNHQFIYVADALSSEISGFQLLANGTLAPVPGSPFLVQSQPPVTVGPDSLAYIPPYLIAAGSNPNTPTSLTVFHVNPTTGSLTLVPASSGATAFMDWEFLVGDASKRVIYAVGENNSSTTQSNGISAFRVTTSGAIQQIGPKIVTGSPLQAALALDPLGRFLYAFNPGKVWVFKRNSDGTLGPQVAGSPFKVGTPITFTSPSTPDPCFFAAEQPTIAAHPGGHFIYTSCNRGTLITVSAVSSTGQLTPAGSLPIASTQDRLSALFVNKVGTLLFATQEERNEVLTFALVNGHPVFSSRAAAGTRPNGVAASPGSVHLYVSNGSSNIFKLDFVSGSDNLSYYTLSSTGRATQSTHSPISTGAAPRSVTVVITP